VKRSWRTLKLVGIISIVSVIPTGCLGDRCSPDQVLEGGKCVAPEPDGGHDKDGATLPDGDITGMGEYCTDPAECTGQANICVILPGAIDGYCSIDGCSVDPNNCPEGFFCMDISEFTPDYETICLLE
jgi:hypothetical protein